jgi:outer membrane protein assembly factor BamB
LSQLGLLSEAQQVAARHRKELRSGQHPPSAEAGEDLSSLPSSGIVWQQDLELPEAAENLLDSMKKELDLRGFLPPANFSPIVAGDLVIARSLSEVMAVDRNTGATVWRKSAESNSLQLAQSGLLANPQFRQMLAWQLGAFAFADRNTGTLSSDGSRVFVVLTDHAHDGYADSSPWGLNKGFMEDWNSRRLSCCQLMALDVKTGIELWRLPAVLPHRDPALSQFSGRIRDPKPDLFFFGPPLPVGDSLFIVGQKDREIRLFQIAANTGEIEWSQPLATAEVPLIKDRMRRRLACPVVLAGGLLLCPTGAGAIAAVDPHSRSCRWVSRYVREDIPKLPSGAWPPGNAAEQTPWDPWWTGWRDVRVIVRNQTVLFTSPESDHLHAVSRQTGEPLWMLPRGDGLFLADTGHGPVLLIGSQTVRLVNPSNGRVVWTAPTPKPGGRGVVRSNETGPTYLLPLAAGGVLEIDPARKTTRQTFPFECEPWGNLIASGESILMQTHDRLVRLAPLEPGTEPPRDPLGRLGWAKSQREAGRFREAVRVLREWVKEEPKAEEFRLELRETLLAELAAHPERSAMVVPVLEPLLQSADDRIRGWRALAEAEQRAGNAANALGYWLKLMEANPAGLVTCPDDPALKVESSRYIQGAIRDLLDAGVPDVNRQLDALPADSPVRKHLEGPQSRWPASAPRISVERHMEKLPSLYSVPVNAEPGSLCADLNLWLDLQNRRLHFSGGSHSGFWELALPGGWATYDTGTLKAWSVGPVLVLQLGINLFGISPLDDHVQPHARVLWQTRLFGGNNDEEQPFDEITQDRRHQPPAGFGVASWEFLDRFRQIIAQVGPVSAGVVIYQTGGRLVALETATGRKLWSRSQLPSEAFLTGDASHVLLIERDKSRVTVLRTMDGRMVASRDLPTDGKFLTWWKTQALLQKEAPDRLTFSLWDAVAGRFVWRQEAPLKSLGFEVDNRRWGFITPKGKLTLFQTGTGRALETTQLSSVRNPNQVHAFSEESGIYLAISHPKTPPADEEESPIVDDLPLRHPILAGTLHGLDRSGKHLWQSSWGHWAFSLEQPAAGPVLVLHRRFKSIGQGEYFEVRYLEKSTGKTVYEAKSTEMREAPRWSGSSEQGQFELKAYGNTVRLRYN